MSIWRQTNAIKWREIVLTYPDQLLSMGKPDLVKNDKWIWTELPKAIKKRAPPYLTQPELARVMAWKLARGKFRPSLKGYIAALSDKQVRDASTEAFDLVKSDLKGAIKSLSKLRGVGPATASLVLACFDENVPFMADEALESVPGLGPIKYTLPHYLKFAEALQNKAKELNEGNSESGTLMTAQSVSQSLWVAKRRSKGSVKRKRVSESEKVKKRKLN
eukprot:501865_1